MRRGSGHSKYFDRMERTLSKEWREDIDEIRTELFKHRDQENEVKTGAFD